MRYPDPHDPSHMVAFVRDKIRDRPGYSDGSLRVAISTILNDDPWLMDIVLAESPDDLAARFIANDDS